MSQTGFVKDRLIMDKKMMIYQPVRHYE